jgi:protein-S-isoprenylcysteine O-methyltransferase Ste14
MKKPELSDRWIGWPYGRVLLVGLLVLMAILAVMISVAAVRYEGSSVVEELVRWGLTVALLGVITVVSILFRRRRKRSH